MHILSYNYSNMNVWKGRKYMGIFLGRIEKRDDFVNFKPFYELRDDRLEQLGKSDYEKLLPDSIVKTINIYRYGGDKISNFYWQNQYLFLEFETEELEENRDSSGELRKSAYKIDELRYGSKNKIHTQLSEFGYYVYIEKDDYVFDKNSNRLKILNNYLHKDMEIVLESIYADCVYGPFKLNEDSNGFYVVDEFISQECLLKGWSLEDSVDKYLLTLQLDINLKLFHKMETEVFFKDLATNEYLLKQFRRTLKTSFIKDNKVDLLKLDEAIKEYEDHIVMSQSESLEEIKDERIDRIKNIFNDERHKEKSFLEISKVINDFIVKYENSEQYLDFINKLADDSEFMTSIQNYKIIQEKINKNKVILSELEQKVNIFWQEIEREKAHAKDDIAKQNSELLKEKEEYEQQLEKIKKELGIVEEIESLENRKIKLKGIVEERQKDLNQVKIDTDRVITTFSASLKDMTGSLAKNILDPIIANEMLRVEESWKSDQQKELIAEYVTKMETLSTFHGDVKNEIYQRIHKYRNYKINEIYNILICICQGFVTVFSGEPGTGKTSICNIISHTLGLTKINKRLSINEDKYYLNRYIQVSVEKGWTSKRDLIGYYNPLTKTFDRSNRRLFEGLNMLDYEAKHTKSNILPYLVLLDEANLSPMEYYWAEFMNLCDDRENNNLINLGEDYTLTVPEHLSFLATINNDHTTESLSPRLIDRAWTIVLPTPDNVMATSDLYFESDTMEPIAWSDLKAEFGVACEESKISGVAEEIYERFIEKLNQRKIAISPRSNKAVAKYWTVASQCFVVDNEIDPSIIALDFALAQKILPQLSGFGQEYREFLVELYELSNKENLIKCKKIIERIIERGDQNMKSYRFYD